MIMGICQVVTELAVEESAAITASEFRTLNYSLDHAIALAVAAYQKDREQSIAEDETKRLGFFAHELRNRLAAATMAFEAIRRGKVAAGGSTSAVLERNLSAMRDLISRSLSQVRIESGRFHMENFRLSEFMEDAEVDAMLNANNRGLQFKVSPVARDIMISGDRQILAGAVSNLLQNAFKFTEPPGQVEMRAHITADRIIIEVEDECGGLPPGRVESLFLPYEQHGRDRGGLGLGLAITKKSVELHHGELRVRDLPGKGCIFTIDLPRPAGSFRDKLGGG